MQIFRLIKKFLLTIFCLIAMSLAAQVPAGDALVLIDVTVVDVDDNPLPGAIVQVKGKAQGVVATVDGKVSLWVDRGNQIEFKYLGMQPLTMTVTKPITGKIIMEEVMSELDQVVVTGYQRTTKRRTTGSLGVLDTEDLKGSPTANIDMLMQGKLAGVDVKAVSGRPGESARIRIRGTNTITGNAEPLWVVDGVPLQRDIPRVSSQQIRAENFNDIFTNGISGINPNDIESITVLKDASAAAIYGSRAAGGVIVVTTKRGKEGKMQVNYSANVSVVSSPPRNANLMNSREKLAWEQELWDEFSAEGFESGERYPVIGVVGMIRSGYDKYKDLTLAQQNAEIDRLGAQTTDWFEELFQNSVSNSHYLSLSGGSEKNAYHISLGYMKNNGLVKKTDYSRYNVGSKIDLKPTNRIKIGLSADFALQGSKSPSLGVDPFRYAYFSNPYEKPFNEDGSYAADATYHSITHANKAYAVRLPEEGYNIFREIDQTSNDSKNMNASLVANLSVNILDNFSFEGLASYGYVTDMQDNIHGKNTYSSWMDRPFDSHLQNPLRRYGSITQTSSYNSNYNLRGQFHYFNTFADHHYISTLFGSEIRGQYAKSIYEKRYGYDPVSGNSSMPTYPDIGTVEYTDLLSYASIMDGLAGQSIMEDAFASFYLSMDYVLMQRYILSLTGRTDGSNNFGSKEQFNPTGSLGLAWNVDQEEFMESIKPTISSLSLRAAFGYTGNINKSVYPQLVMFYENTFHKTDNDYFRTGTLRNAPNPHLRWEKTRDMKMSMEIGFFNDRLRLQGELYDRRTYDAVTNVAVPYTTGFVTQSYNTSELLNQGAELTVNASIIKTTDWRLSASANISYNRNKLLKYDAPTSNIWGNYPGYPLGSIVSGKVQGIDKRTGIYTYEARPDAVFLTPADRAIAENYAFYLGTRNAPINGGFSMSASYKQLSLSLGGSYSLGGKIKNNIQSPAGYGLFRTSVIERIPAPINDLYVNHLNVTKDASYRWTPDNPITDGNPRIIDAYGEYLGLYNYMITSDVITDASMLENISYFKLGSVMMNYNITPKWLEKISLSSLSVFFSVSNLFILTNYTGIDPETPGAVYPTPRTFSTGLSIGF